MFVLCSVLNACYIEMSFLYARLETGRIMWLGMAGGGHVGVRPHRFPHNNFSSVYRIFTKLGHMIPLWKGKILVSLDQRGKPQFILGSLGQRSP